MSEFVGYVNGEWIPMSQIVPDPNDLGTTKGDQVIEVERTFGGTSFRMKDHIDRLYRSLKYVRIEPDITHEELLSASEEGIGKRREGNVKKDLIRSIIFRVCFINSINLCSKRNRKSR